MTRLILAILALAALATASSAKPIFAQKEKKACTFCHSATPPGVANLNEAGKWYRVKKTLVGFKPKATKPAKPTPAPKKKPTPAPKKKKA